MTGYLPRAHADHPPFSYAAYRATLRRSPQRDLVQIISTLTEITGPGPALAEVAGEEADLTLNAGTGEPAIGERIIVTGVVRDENGLPVPDILIEIWQANASGRYLHWRETDFPAPLDPNFIGVGQFLTRDNGVYTFTTIKPGPYPWGNHAKAWRPAHIHFSILGSSWGTRLVTQMYFEGDPLLPLDPIFNSAPSHSRARMVARYAHDVTIENFALGWRFDLILRGRMETPFEPGE